MSRISVYLTFDGNCREAMTFYQECFGGELALQTIADSPIATEMPPEAGQRIVHATLRKGDLELLGSDMVEPEGLVAGNAISLSVHADSEQEIKTIFANLSVGGHVTYPMQLGFWGGMFGTITDRFGKNWLLNYAGKSAK